MPPGTALPKPTTSPTSSLASRPRLAAGARTSTSRVSDAPKAKATRRTTSTSTPAQTISTLRATQHGTTSAHSTTTPPQQNSVSSPALLQPPSPTMVIYTASAFGRASITSWLHSSPTEDGRRSGPSKAATTTPSPTTTTPSLKLLS